MQIFQVQPWPKGVGNSEVQDYVKVEADDELKAAERVLKMPLQRSTRHDMYIRAFVRSGGRPQGAPIKIFEAEIAPMVWGRRRLASTDYVPYFDMLEKLLMANPRLYRQFIMVSTEADDHGPGVDDFYLGAPNETFLALFDGFERITEGDLPRVIDTLHIADATSPEFRSRFRGKTDEERRENRQRRRRGSKRDQH